MSAKLDSKAPGPDLKRARRPQPTESVAAAANQFDFLPPHSPEAEVGVLGCLMLDPKAGLAECAKKFRGQGGEVFYDLRNQSVYDLMVDMDAKGEAVDAITLQRRLKDANLLERVGGLAYLSTLPDQVPSAANLPYYLDIVSEKHTLRKVVKVCTEAVAGVRTWDGDVSDYLDKVEREVLSVRGRSTASDRPYKEAVQSAMQRLEAMWSSGGKITGLPTGFPDLDKASDGLYPGEVTILSALPSFGKTTLAMNIVDHLAVDHQVPVGVLSLEMKDDRLAMRHVLSRAKVNWYDIRDQKVTEGEFDRLSRASLQVSKAPVYMVFDPDMTDMRIRAEFRRMAQQHNIKVGVLDYMQLASAESLKRGDNREREVAAISKAVKSSAGELGIHVLALSQLTETEHGLRLRGSADIGQDADNVWMIQEGDEEPSEDEEAAGVCSAVLWVQKARNAMRNVKVKLTFFKRYTKFESQSRVDGYNSQT